MKKKEVKTKQDLPFQNQNEAHTGLLRRSWLPTVEGEAQDLVNQSLFYPGKSLTVSYNLCRDEV